MGLWSRLDGALVSWLVGENPDWRGQAKPNLGVVEEKRLEKPLMYLYTARDVPIDHVRRDRLLRECTF